MDRQRRTLHRSDEAAHRRNLRHLQDLRGGRGRDPQHGRARRARDRRGRGHGHRSGREELESRERRRTEAGLRPDLRSHRRDASHRGKSVLGHPPHARQVRIAASASTAADQTGADRRSPAHARRRHRRQPGDGTLRRTSDARERRRAHPLQRRSAGHLRLRHRARRHSRRRRAGKENPRLSPTRPVPSCKARA